MKRIKYLPIVLIIAIIIIMSSVSLILKDDNDVITEKNQNTELTKDKNSIYDGKNRRDNSDWPMHLYDSIHNNYVDSDGPINNNVLWSNSTGGSTYSSPAIVDGKVYIGSRNGSSSEHDFMNCFYANNGTLLWRFETFEKVSNNYGLTSSPAIDNDYIFFGADRLYCLYANNGTMKWNIPTGNKYYGDGTPTVANGKVFIGACDWKAYCINQESGNIIWTFQTKTGTSGSNYGVFAAPAVVNGFVYVAGADGIIYQINETQATTTATADNTYDTGRCIYSSPVVTNGRVFFGNGYSGPDQNSYLYCLNADNLDLIWKFDPGYNTGFFSSGGYHDGKIFYGSTDKRLYCFDATSNSADVIWSYNFGKATWSSPAIVNNRLYIGSKSNYVYCFNTTQGAIPEYYWNYNTNGQVDSSPAIVDGKVFIGSHGNGGKLICFGESGGDIIPPKVEGTIPIDDDTNISISTQISITFSEPMDEISVEDAITISPLIGYTTGWEGNSITMTLSSDLDYSTEYEITVDTGAKDIAGNPLNVEYTFQFTTEKEPDTIPPEVEAAYPSNNSMNVSISTTISITFSEIMDKNSVENSISILPSIDFDISWDENTIILILSSNLDFSTEYTVRVETGAKDISDNFLENEYSFSFTSEEEGDTTPPEILSTLPENGNTDILVDTTISLTFSEAMNQTSVDNAININPSISYTLTWNGNIISITPDDDLEYLTNYTITIGIGAMDLANNSLGEEYVFYFLTVDLDNISPTIILTNPNNGSIDNLISTTISITFSETMNSTSVKNSITIFPDIEYDISWNGNKKILTPISNLGYNKEYKITIGTEAKDLFENFLETEYSFNFITEEVGDIIAPEITSTGPIDGANNVETDSPISITFSESMNQVSVENAIQIAPTISYTTSWIGNELTITPIVDLDFLTNYFIIIKTQSKDLAGNNIEEEYNFSFKTKEEGDRIPPTILSTKPSKGDSGVSLDSTISISFSEAMKHSSVESGINISPPIIYNISWEGNNIILETELNYLINYTITIGVQAEDINGNRVVEKYRFSFTTENEPDIIHPIIFHEPVIESNEGKKIEITATITDNIIITNAILYYRKTGSTDYSKTTMSSEGYEYSANIPASGITTNGIEYYIWATDGINNATHPSEDLINNPHKISVYEEKGEDSSVIIYLIPIIGIMAVGIIGFVLYRKKSS